MIRYNTLEEQYKADLSGDMVYIENGYKVIDSILKENMNVEKHNKEK